MITIEEELKKKKAKKNVKRSRQGNTAKQSETHNPDNSNRFNKFTGKAEKYVANEHIMNDSRITLD